MRTTKFELLALAIAGCLGAAGLQADEANVSDKQPRPYSPYADRDYPSNAYFGETHLHTALSADAGGGGARLMPRDAYRFARGEQILSNTGQPVKLARPLDFMCITPLCQDRCRLSLRLFV